ncbi:MAG TPA: NAD(P)/FAD-dependent oxidoreductase [Thermoleophilaceae bacterium]|nr:NAD(P)/FAD-dependent oxidoreductase [Thermoleophilaceae bacterium]
MAERAFDAVVLGAGPAGEVAAGRLADGGLSVALVEPHLVGGECSFYACMPSKALLRPGEVLAEVRRVPGAAEAVGGELDVGAVLARRDEVIHDLDDAVQLPWVEDKGIELIRDAGRLDGERRVRVGDDVLVAERAVVVATGSAAAIPPIDGLRKAEPWTNREGTTAKEVPARLAVLGGGVAGVELAQAWRRLGSQVTIFQLADRLLEREEPFAGEQVGDSLRALGVDVRVGASVTAVRANGGEVVVEVEDGPALTADELLVSTGRRPRTDDIGIDSVGLEPGKSIDVDDRMRATTVDGDWLYAVGDVNGRVQLTHMGKYQARAAADNILGKQAEVTADGPVSPRVIFTEPQVAAVGHTLASAREAGLRVRAVDVDTEGSAGGSFVGKGAAGTCRIVVDEDRRTIVGATFTGVEVAESLHAATIAVVAEVPLDRLWHAIPSFPTRSELWLNLLEAYGL